MIDHHSFTGAGKKLVTPDKIVVIALHLVL